jgi:hypothetical protein
MTKKISELDKILDMADNRRIRILKDARTRRKQGADSWPRRLQGSVYRKDIPEKEDVLNFIRANDVKSAADYKRKSSPSSPGYYHCLKLFGSWSEAKKCAYGESTRVAGIVKCDAGYIISMVIQYELWSLKAYAEAHAKRPDIIPPTSVMVKHFGGFRNLLEAVLRMALKPFLERYVELYFKLDRVPTVDECNSNGLPLDMAIRHFGSKDVLDRDLFGMVADQPKKTRSKRAGLQAKPVSKRRQRRRQTEGSSNEKQE